MKAIGTTLIGSNAERLGLAPLHAGWRFYEEDTGAEYIVNEAGDAWIGPTNPGAAHDLLSATHPDTLPGVVVQGDLATGNATPKWARLPKGVAHQMLKMNAGGTAPGYEAFVWDEMAGVAGADMIHSHVSDAEGGTILLDSVTRTVKPGGGGDFLTIQGAVDWFADKKILYGDNIIEVDAGSYDEAIVFTGVFCVPGATLTLRGDTRVLPGMACIDTNVTGTNSLNRRGLANGGSGTCALSNAGNDLTVTGGPFGNPDFDADGIVAGDRIITRNNAGAIAVYTTTNVVNNVFTLTVAAPAIGNDGTAVCVLPNRSIERTAAGRCIYASGPVRGIVIEGFYLKTDVGAECHGIDLFNGPNFRVSNVVTWAVGVGVRLSTGGSVVIAETGNVSMWGGQYGVFLARTSFATLWYVYLVGASVGGVSAQDCAWVSAAYMQATACVRGFYILQLSWAYLPITMARQCTIAGYYSGNRGYIQALATSGNNNGNAVNYNPPISNVWGTNLGSITWS